MNIQNIILYKKNATISLVLKWFLMKISVKSSQISRFQRDIYIILLLSVIAIISSLYSSHFLNTAIKQDTYFEADIARVYANMSNRYSNHYRTNVPPYFH